MMDSEALLPVRIEELTNLEVPRRVIGLADLIPDLTRQALVLGIADSTNLREGHTWHSTGRYLKISLAGPWLGIDHEKWSRYGITPLWIVFHNTEYGRARFVLEALKAWAPPRMFEEGGRALVALTVLPDVTRERVLEDLLDQLRRLHAAL